MVFLLEIILHQVMLLLRNLQGLLKAIQPVFMYTIKGRVLQPKSYKLQAKLLVKMTMVSLLTMILILLKILRLFKVPMEKLQVKIMVSMQITKDWDLLLSKLQVM